MNHRKLKCVRKHPRSQKLSLSVIQPPPLLLSAMDTRRVPAENSNSYLLQHYGDAVLTDLHRAQEANRPLNCLQRHTISPLLRAHMVDWLIEVCSECKLSRRSFALSISIMDNFYLRTTARFSGEDIHLTGVTCIYMASKLVETAPLRLQTVQTSVAGGQLGTLEIARRERDIFCTLDFCPMFVTALDMLDTYSALLEDLVLRLSPVVGAREVLTAMKDGAMVLILMTAYDYGMLGFYPSTLAGGALYAMTLKLSSKYERGYDWMLVNCMRELSGGEERNVRQMEGCAVELLKLEAEFGGRFCGLTNLFTRCMLP